MPNVLASRHEWKQGRLHCDPSGNRAISFQRVGRTSLPRCDEGNRAGWKAGGLAVNRFIDSPGSPAMWVHWTVEDDGTIMRRAFNSEQRLERDKMGRVTSSSWPALPAEPFFGKSNTLGCPLGLKRSSTSPALAKTTKHCALLRTNVDNILMDAAHQLRDWLGVSVALSAFLSQCL